jgi:hypothetical protein
MLSLRAAFLRFSDNVAPTPMLTAIALVFVAIGEYGGLLLIIGRSRVTLR